MDTNAILEQRGTRYGEFRDQAKIAQAIRRAYTLGRNWDGLSSDKRESLELIANKIGRILNGDPEYDDNWIDICGYSQLIVNEIKRNAEDRQSQGQASAAPEESYSQGLDSARATTYCYRTEN